jgi:hypothetical protein
MKTPNIPEFTAEASLCPSIGYYRSVFDNRAASNAILPQMMTRAEAEEFMRSLLTGPGVVPPPWLGGGGGDVDPGGWGVPPWIGDVACRQCRARCSRIQDPVRKEDCFDSCPCD